MSILPISSDRVSLKSLVPFLPSGIQQRIRDSHYSAKLRSARITDEVDLGVIELLVSEGDQVMDIGANFGLFSRFLSERVGPEGTVYAFEPTRVMSHVLKHNLASLQLTNVIPSSLAVSDRVGKARLAVPKNEDQTPNFYEASLCEISDDETWNADEIETTTLDVFCEENEIERLSFFKCDVEGHEIAVLNGARITLEKFRPSILIEVNESLDETDHGRRVHDLIGFLGYGIHVFDEGRIRNREEGEQFLNYVLLPE